MNSIRSLGARPLTPDERDYKLLGYGERIAVETPNTSLEFPVGLNEEVHWHSPIKLDQDFGGEARPACVGFSTCGWRNSEPDPHSFGDEDALKLYEDITAMDDVPDYWTEEHPVQQGSDLRSAFKLEKLRGHIGAYAFISDVSSLAAAIRKFGPALIDAPWLTGMDTPTPSGIAYVGGTTRGWHQWEIVGYLSKTSSRGALFECKQTWGDSYGVITPACPGGDGFYVTEKGMGMLLNVTGAYAGAGFDLH